MPRPSLLDPANWGDPARDLGRQLAERIEDDLGESIECVKVNPKGYPIHVLVNDHSFFLSQSDGNHPTADRLVQPAGTLCEAALWQSLSPNQQREFAAKNPAVARLLADQPVMAEIDRDRIIKWEGYTHDPMTIQERVNELGDDRALVADLFPRASIINICGDSGEGKSPFVYQAGYSIAVGIDFLGHATIQGNVLIVDYENGQGQIVDLLKGFENHFGKPLARDGLILVNANDVPPEFEQPGHTLLDLIQDFRPDIAIIDSLGSAYPEVEGKNQTANRTYKKFREVISATRTTIVLLVHTKKISDDPQYHPPRLENCELRQWFHHRARGAAALVNASDVRIALEAHSKAAVIVRGFRRLAGEFEPMLLNRVMDKNGRTPLAYERVADDGLLFNDDQAKALAKLPDEFTYKEARQLYGRNDSATAAWVKKCIDCGLVEQEKKRGPYRKVVK